MLRHIHRFTGNYTFLLITLLLLLVQPIVRDFEYANITLSIAISLVIISAVMTLYKTERLHLALWLLSVPAVLSQWVQHSGLPQYMVADVSREIFSSIFLAFCAVIIIMRLLNEERVTVDSLAGAVSTYLLMGMAFASLYLCINTLTPGSFLLEPGGIPLINGPEAVSDYVYYSFVTLTTVGFGDALPISAAAKSLTIIEAVCGQMYLAILIAILVGKHFIAKRS